MRRVLLIVLGILAVVEIGLWSGVASGWFTHGKP
jgi:hypothetical protein